MSFYFTKMHGLGNDFVLIDGVTQDIILTPEQILKISDRNVGIGCDQLLIVAPPKSPNMDFMYHIFNRDGSEVDQCGNGARCVAHFLHYKKLTNKKNITIETKARPLSLKMLKDGDVMVDMGYPNFNPKDVPFNTDKTNLVYELPISKNNVKFSVVSLGNPHAVIFVNDINNVDVNEIGSQLSSHFSFPKGCNVGFAQVLDRKRIKLRVYERGVGETKACGSGACAAMVVAKQQGLVESQVQVHLPGGVLSVEWIGDNFSVFMKGSATWVYDGYIKL